MTSASGVRAARLGTVRDAVVAIGAPEQATEDATAMLLSLSGADASWPLHDTYGLPIERIPDVIANTAQLIVDRLEAQAQAAVVADEDSAGASSTRP